MKILLILLHMFVWTNTPLAAGISKDLKSAITKKYVGSQGQLKVRLSGAKKVTLKILKLEMIYDSGVGMLGRKIDPAKLTGARFRPIINKGTSVTVYKVKVRGKNVEFGLKDEEGHKCNIKVIFSEKLTDENFSFDELDRRLRKAIGFQSYVDLHPDWEQEVIELIEKYEIRIGMNEDQVVESLGNPDGIRISGSGDSTKSRWTYRMAKRKYKRLVFEDGLLVSVEDIKE